MILGFPDHTNPLIAASIHSTTQSNQNEVPGLLNSHEFDRERKKKTFSPQEKKVAEFVSVYLQQLTTSQFYKLLKAHD